MCQVPHAVVNKCYAADFGSENVMVAGVPNSLTLSLSGFISPLLGKIPLLPGMVTRPLPGDMTDYLFTFGRRPTCRGSSPDPRLNTTPGGSSHDNETRPFVTIVSLNGRLPRRSGRHDSAGTAGTGRHGLAAHRCRDWARGRGRQLEYK